MWDRGARVCADDCHRDAACEGPTYLRADLRRADRLLACLGSKDVRLTKSAIGAFIRSDARGFSLLGYALYEVAAQRGIVLKRPRKYDF